MSNFNKVGPDLNEKGDGENQPKMTGDREEIYKSQENPKFDRMESENTFIGPMDSIRQTVPEDIGKIYYYLFYTSLKQPTKSRHKFYS